MCYWEGKMEREREKHTMDSEGRELVEGGIGKNIISMYISRLLRKY